MSNKSSSTSFIKDLTQGGILSQLIVLAVPLMATSFIQMTYNLIDLMWVGRLGSESAAAIGANGMLMWTTFSIALLTKVGSEVTIGQSIGAKRLDLAAIYASHTTTISFLIGGGIASLFFFFPELFISFFKLESHIAVNAELYLKIISISVPFWFMILNFSAIYVGSGRSDIPFYFNVAGLLVNIILDPFFIFGIGFFPRLEVAGAAVATCLSQLFVFILFVWHLKKKQGVLGGFRFFIIPNLIYVWRIVKIGFPVAAMNVFFAFININLVRIASIHGGHLGVTSQTTGGQIEGITWNTSQGFATALGSFVAQNFAAGKMGRAISAYKYTLLIMGVLGIVVTTLFMGFGENIFAIFIPEKKAYMAGGEYLFIVGISQLFMMLEITTQGMFNGVGKTMPPAIVSVVFNTLRLPAAFFLASHMGIAGVWWAITISTILKGTILAVWSYFINRKVSRVNIEQC